MKLEQGLIMCLLASQCHALDQSPSGVGLLRNRLSTKDVQKLLGGEILRMNEVPLYY